MQDSSNLGFFLKRELRSTWRCKSKPQTRLKQNRVKQKGTDQLCKEILSPGACSSLIEGCLGYVSIAAIRHLDKENL